MDGEISVHGDVFCMLRGDIKCRTGRHALDDTTPRLVLFRDRWANYNIPFLRGIGKLGLHGLREEFQNATRNIVSGIVVDPDPV
jgi:hypothetical protein